MKDIFGFLIMILLVYIVGCFVKRHQNRINKEIEKGIIHGYKLKSNKIGDKKVIVEFAPPKGLSPIEVGYLYDMEIGKSDIVCLLYKWAEMGIISLSYKDHGLLIVEKKGIIPGKNVPNYEIEFWDLFFEQGNTVIFPNNFSYDNLGNFKNSVKNYCRDRGWITKKDVYFSIDDFFKTIIPGKKPSKDITYIPYGRLISFLVGFLMIIAGAFVFLKSIILGKMVVEGGLIFVGLLIIGMLISFSFGVTLSETANKHTATLTEKGQEIAAEIHGYKKFIEACDEKQLKEFMRQDPLYLDKILPYAVAFGLENIISKKLPKKLSVKEGSLEDLLRFEKVI